MSPAQMFEHGIARAGYIEAPRDRDLAYEFLKVEFRKVQHYGVDLGGRRYNGSSLNAYRNVTSLYKGKAKGRWPMHYDPDDITGAYFRDPETRKWHILLWEHAPSLEMPLSEDALRFARKLPSPRPLRCHLYPPINDSRCRGTVHGVRPLPSLPPVTSTIERWNRQSTD
jgi:hypothetical protein